MYDFYKKNYSKSEVEVIIDNLQTEYEERLKEQKDRIFQLVGELRTLKAEFEALKKDSLESRAAQDNEPAKRLRTIADNCEKYYYAIREKYPLNQQIDDFFEITKKIKAVSDDEYPSDPDEQTNGGTISDEQELSAREIPPPQTERKYLKKRILRPAFTPQKQAGQTASAEIAAAKIFNPKSKIEQFIKTQKPVKADSDKQSGGFNLEDCINPKKQLNLEEICKELGLM